MSAVLDRSPPVAVTLMAKKTKPKEDGQKSAGRPPTGKQVNVRIPLPIVADLEFIAESMGLDLSHVVRIILTDHVAQYLEEARERRHRLDAARKPEGA